MTAPVNPSGYFNLCEPALLPVEPASDGCCPSCGCRLDLYDPWPLCGVCARLEVESF